MNLKEKAARRAVEYVSEGMIVGLGTGSTTEYAIRALGERVAEGLKIRGIPTSQASARLAAECRIPVLGFEDVEAVDLTIDGADEVDPELNLVKGMGGALLREKIVAAATTRELIIVDPSKVVTRLGTRSPLPVEVLPFGWAPVQRRLAARGWRAELRSAVSGSGPAETDNGNYVLDCYFPDGIDDAAATERWLNAIPGVLDNGLFVGLTDLVIVSQESGECRLLECP